MEGTVVTWAVDHARHDNRQRQTRRHHRERHLVVRQPLRAVIDAQVGAAVAVILVGHEPLRVGKDRTVLV